MLRASILATFATYNLLALTTDMKKILAINPGSTSTKLAVYHDLRPAWQGGAHHQPRELALFARAADQLEFRREFVLRRLREGGVPLEFDAVIGRGGLLHPLVGGVYGVNQRMRHDLRHAAMDHACNLGGLIAAEIADRCGCPAYIADPVVVDELLPRARLSGLPGLERKSIFHALNQKAVARKYAASTGRAYEDLNLIVAHLGGGISIGAHRRGRVIDVNNALNGDGPFSPERAGTLPACSLVELCYSGKYTKAQVMRLLAGRGGMMAHLGLNDMATIAERAADGEEPFAEVVEAMVYAIAKQIGAMHVALGGKADAILLTGGIVFSDYVVERLRPQIDFLAPVVVRPGEGEMESLAYNALGALTGELQVREYE